MTERLVRLQAIRKALLLNPEIYLSIAQYLPWKTCFI